MHVPLYLSLGSFLFRSSLSSAIRRVLARFWQVPARLKHARGCCAAQDVASVRVGAVAQVFAHLADAALHQHGPPTQLLPAVLSSGCPSVSLHPFGEHANTSCVQSIILAGDTGSSSTMTYVLLNRCEAPVNIGLARSNGGRTSDMSPDGSESPAVAVTASTTYLADDVGGWAPLPAAGASPPWQAPLTPIKLACGLGAARCVLPPASLTIVDVQ
jgi:hypothetical protein